MYSAETSYTRNARFWVDIIRRDLDPYRIRLTDSAVLGAVASCPGLDVLDAGCGEGYLSRMFARSGANVTGVDVTPALVEAARSAAEEEGLPIRHEVADLAKIPDSDGSYDVVVLNHVMTDLEDPEAPLQEIARVLRPGGRLVVMMLHPCFYGSHAEREGGHRAASPAEYFSVRVVDQQFLVSGITSPARVRIWLRPLADYVSLLTANGLMITALEEPHPSVAEMESDPWWRTHFVRPLFLLLVARKL